MNNKIKTFFLSVIILMLFLNYANANILIENTNFKIFFVKGNVFLVNGNKKSNVKRGAEIFNNMQLIIETGEVVLINKNKTAVRITEKGTYSFNDLTAIASKVNSGITKEYFSYVWESMNESHEHQTHEQNVYGGVYRGETLPMLLPIESTNVMASEITFCWMKANENSTYYFHIFNENKEELFAKEYTDTTVTININDIPVTKNNVYLWYVHTSNNLPENTAFFSFKVADSKWKENFYNNLNKLDLSFSPEVNELMKIYYYESNNVFIEAFELYRNATDKYPDSEIIKEAYQNLLNKI